MMLKRPPTFLFISIYYFIFVISFGIQVTCVNVHSLKQATDFIEKQVEKEGEAGRGFNPQCEGCRCGELLKYTRTWKHTLATMAAAAAATGFGEMHHGTSRCLV